MFRMTCPALVVVLLAVAGCGRSNHADDAARHEDHAAKSETAAPADDAAAPALVDGRQVVRVTVSDAGYDPARVRLAAGTPARFVFVQTSASQCASQVQIPAFDVPVTDLPQGEETVVDFTPGEAGTFSFTCGMSMMRGTIVVES